ncbi:MAG TPA: aminotransferase class I/II-fold pyridoxal phosphate-dependent enzyme [Actinomycetota bacterium]
MSDPEDPAPPRPGFATRAIHDADLPLGIAEQPVSPPIWLTSDYLYESLEHYADVINERRPGYVYGRYGNPTHVALHRVLASLEGAEAAWSFASGMAALHSSLTALLREGGHVVAQRTVYGGTYALLTQVLPGYGISSTFAEPEPDAIAAALRPETGAVLVETLANPTFRVSDVRGIAGLCAQRGVPLVVDNTVPSPFLLRPLEIEGVALVVHATSKYIGGHSDLIGGAVAGPGDLVDRIRHLALNQGTTAGAFEAWLALRGVQTLGLRMARQSGTALRLAAELAGHPKVEGVGYAGLPDHPDHARAAELFGEAGFGAMLSVSLRGGYEAASGFGSALRVARVGSSFGGLRTEVCHPATTSHRQLPEEERAAAGIGDGLLRVAVGGEDPQDLVEDFVRALEKA